MQAYAALFKAGPMTAAQLANNHNVPGGWKRLSELLSQGAVRVVGEVVCPITGRLVLNWDVTDKRPTKFVAKKGLTRREIELRYSSYREALTVLWKDKRTPSWMKALIKREAKKVKGTK